MPDTIQSSRRKNFRNPDLATVLAAKWNELCSRYLPIADEKTIWRYSDAEFPGVPDQGWKLHIAATVLTATTVLERVGPLLHERGIAFKGPRTIEILNRINTGLYFGYPQVGKCFTVYPTSDDEGLELASRLHDLTADLPGPMIPFDGRFSSSSAVYYRYGSFKHQRVLENGILMPAISDQTGRLVPDSRFSIGPEWVVCPFNDEEDEKPVTETERSPLGSTIRIIKAISQRGKGGVYYGADLSTRIPRSCILKEGRRHGEVAINGQDGHERVKYEQSVLRRLRRGGVDVPRVFSSFEKDDNFYLVLEHLAGVDLGTWLKNKKRRLPVGVALSLGIQAAQVISQIHSAGWVWRDCKPSNLILCGKVLRPIDFEGACRIGENRQLNWATKTFIATNAEASQQSQPAVDLYALGVVIHHLLTGKFWEKEKPEAIGKLRRGIPLVVRSLLDKLLSNDPEQRPSAKTVARELRRAYRSLV